jgi:hypothetical protein
MSDKKIDELIKFIEEKMAERSLLIEDLENALKEKVSLSEGYLARKVVTDFVESLSRDDNGFVRNTAENKRLLKKIDAIFKDFNTTQTQKLIKGLVESIATVTTFNKGFYSPLSGNTPVTPISDKVKKSLRTWLGINDNGVAIKGAYLDSLIQNPTTLRNIKDFAFKSIVSKMDFQELKKDFEVLIKGDKQNLGLLQKYYRNFIYDSISQVDRATNREYADALKFRHAIFQGHRLETSRDWCIEKKGKVFAFSEIKLFNPPTAKPPNYNPFTDLGGYGCVDHLNYIPKIIAKKLRKDVPDE